MHADGIDTNRFFLDLELSAFGIWGSFVSCFALLVLALLKMGRYLTTQNLKCSMASKRDQLIGSEDLNRVQDVPVVHRGATGSSVGSGRRRRGKRREEEEEEGVFQEVKEQATTESSAAAAASAPVASSPPASAADAPAADAVVRGRENPSPPGGEESEDEAVQPVGNRLRLSPPASETSS
jgi:hypothetical protein